MKILNIMLILVGISCCSQNRELTNKTYLKLKDDDKSFEQFAFYGFCNCNDNYLYSETFVHNYITTFNHMEPFPRLFEKETIKKVLDRFHASHKKKFDGIQKEYFNGYNIITECYNLYNTSNNELRGIYNGMISNKRIQKEWIEDYMNDYLEHYFIKIETE